MIPTTPAAIFIDFVILLLFACGLIELLYQMRHQLPFERHALLKVRENEETLPGQTVDAKVLQKKLLAGVPEKCAIRHRVESIAAIRQRGGAVDQNALSDVFVGRQSVLGGGSRHVLSSLLILGLVGTLIGLGQAITQAEPLSDPNQLTDLPQIARAIGGTLGGMSTAFSTTFCGLVCTLLLGGVSYWFNRQQTLFISEVEDFTTTVLIPWFYPESTETMLKVSDSLMRTSGAMEMASKKLTDVAWEIRLDESQQLVASFGESTGILSDRLQELRDLHYRLEDRLKQFDETARAIKTSQENLASTLTQFLPDLALRSQAFIEALNPFKDEQKNQLNQLLAIGKTIDERNAILTRELSRLLGQVNQAMETTTHAQADTAHALNQLVQASLSSEQTFEQVNLLRDIAASLKPLQTLPQSFERLVGTPAVAQKPGQESVLNEFQALTLELRQISRRLRDESLIQKQVDMFDQLDKSIQQLNRNLQENLIQSEWKRWWDRILKRKK